MTTPTPYPVGTVCVVVRGRGQGSIIRVVGPAIPSHPHGECSRVRGLAAGTLIQPCESVATWLRTQEGGYVPVDCLRPLDDPDAEPITETWIAETEQ